MAQDGLKYSKEWTVRLWQTFPKLNGDRKTSTIASWILMIQSAISILVLLPTDPSWAMSMNGFHIDDQSLTVIFQPHLCGYSQDCSTTGSKTALKQAKANIDEWYPVVGVLEDLNSTFLALEFILPKFFWGIRDTYYKDLNSTQHSFIEANSMTINIMHVSEPHRNKGPVKTKLMDAAKSRLKNSLTDEYELYEFVKQRLKRQVKAIENHLWAYSYDIYQYLYRPRLSCKCIVKVAHFCIWNTCFFKKKCSDKKYTKTKWRTL